jgi:hypothetical protein
MASDKKKDRMFETVKNRIRSIGNAGGHMSSEDEIIEEVIEIKRYIPTLIV